MVTSGTAASTEVEVASGWESTPALVAHADSSSTLTNADRIPAGYGDAAAS
jgi:hypothetical protein